MGFLNFKRAMSPPPRHAPLAPTQDFCQSYVALACKVPVAVNQLQEWLMLSGVQYKRTEDIPLLMAEVLNNIVEHAYQDSGDGEFRIEAAIRGPSMIAHIHDWGEPVEMMLEGAMPEVENVKIQDLPEGGFGLALIATLSDRVQYHRTQGRNTMTIHKRVFD